MGTTHPLVLCLCLLAAWPLSAAAQVSERERIAAERSAISTLYNQQERDCIQRFATNACVEDVRARRREALAPLRERELNLDEASRHQRAEERRAAVAAKQQAARLRPPAPAELAPAERRPAAPAAATAPGTDLMPRAALASAAHASEAAARAQATRQRQEAAKATQARVAQRLAERAKSARRSAPLPSAAASSVGTGNGDVLVRPPAGAASTTLR
jgi:hypothetical protein